MRKLSFLDHLFSEGQHLLTSVYGQAKAGRENPAKLRMNEPLPQAEQRRSQGFMRVNHTGEICAQALYRGQAFATSNLELKTHFHQAALEENDHLSWCQERLQELNTHTSRLNLFWYSASFLIGYLAAKNGDGVSLGFVEETEKQVVRHLDYHEKHLSAHDHKSRAIIALMRDDEYRHGLAAHQKGAKDLPNLIKLLMKFQAKIMTTTAYYL